MSNVLLSSIVLSPFVLGIALVSALSIDGPTRGEEPAGPPPAHEDRHFELDDVDAVEIEMFAGDLTLRGGAGDGVKVRVLDAHTSPGCHFDVRRDGRTVAIESRLEGLPGRCEFDLEILVPGTLPVELDLGVGNVSLDGLAGALELELGTGNVEGSATGPDLEVSTGTGNVALSGLVSAVDASTGTGNVSLRFDGAPDGTIEASTGVGDVSVLLPPSAVVDADASTGLGKVSQTLTERSDAETVVRASTGVGNVSVGSN